MWASIFSAVASSGQRTALLSILENQDPGKVYL
jgi:hypothetical protein